MRSAPKRSSAMLCSALLLIVLIAPTAVAEPGVDSAPPVVIITGPAALINSTTVNVTWEASDEGSGISHYNVSMDGKSEVEVLDTFLVFNKLSQGNHRVVVTAFDNAGNLASDDLSFVVDSLRPGASCFPMGTQVGVTDSIGAYFPEPMDHSSVVLTFNGTVVPVTWYENPDGSCGVYWLPVTPLDKATQYQVALVGRDLAGNAIERTWSFWTIDYGAIRGFVLDEDGRPISDALVMLNNGWNYHSTEYGEFAMGFVPPGDYTIEISKAGYRSISMNVKVGTLERIDLGNISLAKVAAEPPDGPGGTPDDFTWLLLIVIPVGLALVMMPYLIRGRRR